MVAVARSSSSKSVRTPLQARSARTQERILAAVEKLLETTPFEKITVADIVRHAKSSVGSFYARFADKEALLDALYQRYDAQLGARIDRVKAEDLRALPFEERAAAFVKFKLQMFRERQWLLRALGLHSRAHPERVLDEDLLERRAQKLKRVASMFDDCHDQIGHPDPERAIGFAIFAVSAVFRDKIIFPGPHAEVTEASDAELLQEATRMFLGYLKGA